METLKKSAQKCFLTIIRITITTPLPKGQKVVTATFELDKLGDNADWESFYNTIYEVRTGECRRYLGKINATLNGADFIYIINTEHLLSKLYAQKHKKKTVKNEHTEQQINQNKATKKEAIKLVSSKKQAEKHLSDRSEVAAKHSRNNL